MLKDAKLGHATQRGKIRPEKGGTSEKLIGGPQGDVAGRGKNRGCRRGSKAKRAHIWFMRAYRTCSKKGDLIGEGGIDKVVISITSGLAGRRELICVRKSGAITCKGGKKCDRSEQKF